VVSCNSETRFREVPLDGPTKRWQWHGNALSVSDSANIALDAAHIKRILISSQLCGQGGTDAMFTALSRVPLRTQNRKGAAPKVDFPGWHRAQCFGAKRGTERVLIVGQVRDRRCF
jgi:hypothetical protein